MKKFLVFSIPLAFGVSYSLHSYGFPSYLSGARSNPYGVEFSVQIDYCVGCGFRQSAELFSKKVLEKYPKAKFTLNPIEDEPGSLEIIVTKNNGEQKLLHSSLNGEGKIYKENISKILVKVEDFVLKEN